MKTLETAKTMQTIIASLMELNQNSYVRDSGMKPGSVNWDLEKHGKMFGGLYILQTDIKTIIDSLNQL